MEEKQLSIILGVLADKIDNLNLGIYIKDISYNNLKNENERLKNENDTLRAENERIAADRDFFMDRFGNQKLNAAKEDSNNA